MLLQYCNCGDQSIVFRRRNEIQKTFNCHWKNRFYREKRSISLPTLFTCMNNLFIIFHWNMERFCNLTPCKYLAGGKQEVYLLTL
jgi:hypothetical protein